MSVQRLETSEEYFDQISPDSFEDDQGWDSEEYYVELLASHRLLDRAEEFALAEAIEVGKQAAKELQTEKSFNESDRRQRLQLIEAGQQARRILVRHNLRFVLKHARRREHKGVPFIDLVQEGTIGLIRATDKFDRHRGYTFANYAIWWIKQAMSQSIMLHIWGRRIPKEVINQHYKVHQVVDRLVTTLGREPNFTEIADAVTMPKAELANLLQGLRFPVSFQDPLSQAEDASELSEVIADPEAQEVMDQAMENISAQLLRDNLSLLPDRYRIILMMRFGLIGGKQYTRSEIGEKLGINRETVRLAERDALRFMRTIPAIAQMRHLLEDYD